MKHPRASSTVVSANERIGLYNQAFWIPAFAGMTAVATKMKDGICY